LSCAIIATGGSCASMDPILHGNWVKVEPAAGGGKTAVVQGDWDDLYAAASVSMTPIQAAILGQEHGGQDDRRERLTLTTVDDEPGELIAERLDPISEGPGSIRLTARIGLFGNPAREERLIRAVGERLRELAARDWAPVR